MVSALLDKADRVVDQTRALLELPERQQAVNQRDVEGRGEEFVAGVVEFLKATSYRLDTAARVSPLDGEVTFDAPPCVSTDH
ncbi:hypothetical protein AYJ54_41530 [Bradyrhizobium centrolobii]|uniref:Uncharacterized protein n=1 Tax=Bradyrhizobium centrolobii TaxID=1505087 RepID=A0A176Z2A0_9BRAD|nr:hypothetical protein AYJ54_41530 [Bradyrhizobium centrolobii]